MSDEEEIWKTYPKIPFIEASNLGRVRTKDRYVPSKNGSKRLIKGRVLKQYLNPDGYMYVNFRVNGKLINLRVHRVIATCFIPNPDNLPEVNHIDCNPTNNVVSNLEWCTREYNNAYREKYGKACNRPVIAINRKTFEVFWFKSQHEAARQLDVFQQNISMVVKGKVNRTGDFWFCNIDEKAVEKVRLKFSDEVANVVKELISENCN